MRIAVLFTKRTNMEESFHNDWFGRDKNDDTESTVRVLKELGHDVTEYDVDIDLFGKLIKDRKKIDLAFNLCDDGFFFKC